MEIIRKVVEDKKDIVRAKNAVKSLKELRGEAIKINGIVQYNTEDANEDGVIETKIVTALKLEKEKEFYTSISKTVSDSLEAILEIYTEDEVKKGIEVIVKVGKSNKGREFLYLDV